MGAEPRIVNPRELAGMTPALEKSPGVIAGLGLPEKPSPEIPEPQTPELKQQQQDNGLNSLVLNTQSPKPSEPSGPGGLA